MSEQQKSDKNESSRNLLAEIEGDWDSPKPAPVVDRDRQAELDAAADRLVESLNPPPASVQSLDDLDTGWDDDDDDDDDDAEEPELPDERLDPVAYAVAKQARDDRMEARRQRRRIKAETKKARRKARADAQKSKQKGKTRKARAPQRPAAPAKVAKAAKAPRIAVDDDTDEADAAPRSAAIRKPSPNRLPTSKPLLSGTNQWMLAIAVAVFVAAAIFAAVVTR